MRHGTRSCYQNGCQRLDCIKANRDYARRWYRTHARPDHAALAARVPAGPTRTHLHQLLAQGHTLRAISRATGISQATLSRIARGLFTTVHRRTRTAIHSLAPANVAFVKTSSWDDIDDLATRLAQILDDRLAPWRAMAACRHPGIPVDTFYAARGEPVDLAKAICARCPVTTDCAAYATTHHIQTGIWAGLAPKDRRPGRRHVA